MSQSPGEYLSMTVIKDKNMVCTTSKQSHAVVDVLACCDSINVFTDTKNNEKTNNDAPAPAGKSYLLYQGISRGGV